MIDWRDKQIGKYEIKELLGYGGMATVYKSAVMYTLAIGVGTSLGEFWPRKSGWGYLVFGCLGVILVYRSVYWSLGALIGLGVVLGTGVAKILERRSFRG